MPVDTVARLKPCNIPYPAAAKGVVVPHSVSSDLSQPALGNNHLSSLDLCCKQPRLHDLCCKQPRSPTPWQNCLSAHGLRFFYDSERSPGKMFCVDVNFSVLSQARAGSAIIIKLGQARPLLSKLGQAWMIPLVFSCARVIATKHSSTLKKIQRRA